MQMLSVVGYLLIKILALIYDLFEGLITSNNMFYNAWYLDGVECYGGDLFGQRLLSSFRCS